MKTSDVKAALRAHYKVAEYALMWEVSNATGSNSRRHADAVVMNLWPSRGLFIEGIEIKVSRSDWRRELEQPEKSEPIARYCDYWWIVAPAGIVQEHEVPAMWGYKQVSDKGAVRTIKQAPKKDPVPLDRGFVAAMLRRASEADAGMVERLVDRQIAAERERIAKEIETGIARRTRSFEKLEDKLAKLKEAGIDLMNQWESSEDMIASYKLGKALRSNYRLTGGLKHHAKTMAEISETLAQVHDTLFAEESVQ